MVSNAQEFRSRAGSRAALTPLRRATNEICGEQADLVKFRWFLKARLATRSSLRGCNPPGSATNRRFCFPFAMARLQLTAARTFGGDAHLADYHDAGTFVN